jgi:hypothetical protein
LIRFRGFRKEIKVITDVVFEIAVNSEGGLNGSRRHNGVRDGSLVRVALDAAAEAVLVVCEVIVCRRGVLVALRGCARGRLRRAAGITLGRVRVAALRPVVVAVGQPVLGAEAACCVRRVRRVNGVRVVRAMKGVRRS